MKSRPARATAVKKAVATRNNVKKAATKRAQPATATTEAAKSPGKQPAAETRVAAQPASDVPPVRAPGTDVAEAPATARRAGLKLEPSCTLRDALDMQFQLLATDFGDSDVLLDGSAVERIDTAGLQMLVAFAKQHSAGGRRMQWTAASQELQRGSRLLGLDEALGLIPSPPEVSGGH